MGSASNALPDEHGVITLICDTGERYLSTKSYD